MIEEENVGLTFSDEDFERRYSSEDASGAAGPSRPQPRRQGLRLPRSAAAATGSCEPCCAAAWPPPVASDPGFEQRRRKALREQLLTLRGLAPVIAHRARFIAVFHRALHIGEPFWA